jgi:hypothetical protein
VISDPLLKPGPADLLLPGSSWLKGQQKETGDPRGWVDGSGAKKGPGSDFFDILFMLFF